MDKMNNKIQFCFPSKFHSTCANKFLPWHLKGEERAVPRSSFGRPRLCLAWCPLVILRACCSYQLVPVDVVPWTSTTWPWLESGWLWIKKTWGLEEKNKKTPWDSTNFSTKDDRWIPTNPTRTGGISDGFLGIPWVSPRSQTWPSKQMPNGWRNAWMRCGWVRRFIGEYWR